MRWLIYYKIKIFKYTIKRMMYKINNVSWTPFSPYTLCTTPMWECVNVSFFVSLLIKYSRLCSTCCKTFLESLIFILLTTRELKHRWQIQTEISIWEKNLGKWNNGKVAKRNPKLFRLLQSTSIGIQILKLTLLI